MQVKRVAMAELQRAVAQAERRALESAAGERLKMEMLLETAAAARGKPANNGAKDPSPIAAAAMAAVAAAATDIVDPARRDADDAVRAAFLF